MNDEGVTAKTGKQAMMGSSWEIHIHAISKTRPNAHRTYASTKKAVPQGCSRRRGHQRTTDATQLQQANLVTSCTQRKVKRTLLHFAKQPTTNVCPVRSPPPSTNSQTDQSTLPEVDMMNSRQSHTTAVCLVNTEQTTTKNKGIRS